MKPILTGLIVTPPNDGSIMLLKFTHFLIRVANILDHSCVKINSKRNASLGWSTVRQFHGQKLFQSLDVFSPELLLKETKRNERKKKIHSYKGNKTQIT